MYLFIHSFIKQSSVAIKSLHTKESSAEDQRKSRTLLLMPDCSHGKFLMKPERSFPDVLAEFREKARQVAKTARYYQCNIVLRSK